MMHLPHRHRSPCTHPSSQCPSPNHRATRVSVSSMSAFTRHLPPVHLPRRHHRSASHRHLWSCRIRTQSWSRSLRRHKRRSSVFVSSSHRCQNPALRLRRLRAQQSSDQGDVVRFRTTEAAHTTAGRTMAVRRMTMGGRMWAAMSGARLVSLKVCHYRWSLLSRWVCSSPHIYSSKAGRGLPFGSALLPSDTHMLSSRFFIRSSSC